MADNAPKTWTDDTSYSRDEKNRTPRAWMLRLTPDLRIWVGSDHVCHKGKWVLSCDPWFDAKPLAAKTAGEAQTEALALVRGKLAAIAALIDQTDLAKINP